MNEVHKTGKEKYRGEPCEPRWETTKLRKQKPPIHHLYLFVTAKRIMVYGTTGSGKTTLAARLAAARNLPYHAIDDLTWEPNWKAVSLERQCEIISELVAQDEWVIDAGYGTWLDLVLPRVELIVGLDYPPPFIFFRLLRRTLLRTVDKKPICNGNHENWRQMLSRDSILVWFFKSYRRKRTRMRTWAGERPAEVVLFGKPRDAEAWVLEAR